jgi:type IV secretion system protein VirB2
MKLNAKINKDCVVKFGILAAPVLFYAALIMVSPDSAFAADGIQKVSDLLDKVRKALAAAGVAVIAIAIIWAGYRLAYCHSSMQDIVKPVGGAILIGAALEIAQFLIPTTS